MARETADGTFEVPEYRDEPWYENGTVDPETGEEQTVDGYVDHLQQIETRAPIVIESWSDLPANDPERVDTQTGQGRQRYVLSEDLLVYDDGEQWRALGGLGSADRPLPEQHVESLHAEEVSNTVRYIFEGTSIADINSTIESVSEAGGGYVFFEPNQTITSAGADDFILNKSNVTLWGYGVTITAEDGLADSDGSNDVYPSNGLITFDQPVLGGEKATNAHVKGFHIDGNATNNADFSDRRQRQGILCHQVTFDDSHDTPEGNTDGPRPENCTIEDVTVEDTIAANISVGGRNCHVKNATLQDSADDPLLYIPSGIGCTVSGLDCSGAGSYIFKIGGGVSGVRCENNLIENVHIHDLVGTTLGGRPLNNIILWESTDGVTRHNNVVRSLMVRDDNDVPKSFRHRQTNGALYDLDLKGDCAAEGIIFPKDGTGFDVTGRVEITDVLTDGTGRVVFDSGSDDTTIDLEVIVNSTTNGSFRGVEANGTDGGVVTDMSVSLIAETSKAALQANNTVENLNVKRLVQNGGGEKYSISSDTTLAEGVMIPHNLLNVVDSLDVGDEGWTGYHDGTDGTSTNTKGPAFWTGGHMESLRDNSQIE